jgi:hypothetical protein
MFVRASQIVVELVTSYQMLVDVDAAKRTRLSEAIACSSSIQNKDGISISCDDLGIGTEADKLVHINGYINGYINMLHIFLT